MELQGWSYIALLGAVIIVFSFMLPRQTKAIAARQSTRDELEQMELSLGQFMENMEQQHDELVQVVSTSMNQLKEDNRQKGDVITQLEKKCAMLEEQMATLSHAYVALETKLQFVGQAPEKSYQSASAGPESATEESSKRTNPNSIHARYADIFELYNAGKSIEFIAKKLGKTKGEVQLIMQLAKQEEKIQHG